MKRRDIKFVAEGLRHADPGNLSQIGESTLFQGMAQVDKIPECCERSTSPMTVGMISAVRRRSTRGRDEPPSSLRARRPAPHYTRFASQASLSPVRRTPWHEASHH